MAWYRSGTIAVTNGSAVVTGTGTAFVANVQAGHAINLPDGRAYEVAAVNSDTQITLGNPSGYLGATASGQAYSVQPNQGFAQQAAVVLGTFLSQYGGYLSTALAGRFGDGTAAAPGITFASDQDTGICRVGENQLGLVTGGALRTTVSPNGNLLVGRSAELDPSFRIHSERAGSVPVYYVAGGSTSTGALFGVEAGGATEVLTYQAGYPLRFGSYNAGSTKIEWARFDPSGNLGVGTTAPLSVNGKNVEVSASDYARFVFTSTATSGRRWFWDSGSDGTCSLTDGTAGIQRILCLPSGDVRINGTSSGNLLVGTTTSSGWHNITKAVSEGSRICQFDNSAKFAAAFFASTGGAGSSAAATLLLASNGGTGRSINAGGTINASGADYAEYMTKATGCGTILKGQVCGVDADGNLVTAWASARSFVVKTTNPNVVGGDTWAAHLGDRPTELALVLPTYDGPAQPTEPVEPVAPAAIDPVPTEPVREDDEDDDALAIRKALYFLASAAWIQAASDYHVAMAAYTEASSAYATALAEYRTDLAAYQDAAAAHAAAVAAAEAEHETAHARYLEDLTTFENALEAARGTVDRIAFCGQVPLNVTGEFAAGDYIVAAQDGDGIKAVAVAAGDISFDQYRARIGKVWAVRDGRAWIDVQHG